MPILQSLESMERISRQALAADLDAVLERVSRENIGLVITDEGKDDLVLCPASWFDFDYVESEAVVRYARCHYRLFDEKTLSVAVADLERELEEPMEPLKKPQVWKELLELFQQRLAELRQEDSNGDEKSNG